jgi:hypothetical protein
LPFIGKVPHWDHPFIEVIDLDTFNQELARIEQGDQLSQPVL